MALIKKICGSVAEKMDQ